MGDAISDYLLSYAEKEAALHAKNLKGEWETAVVLPSYGEGAPVLKTLKSLGEAAETFGRPVLCLFVINERENGPAAVSRENEDSARTARGFQHPYLSVCILDHFSQGSRLPDGQGVGLARRLGADTAAVLFNEKRLRSPLLRTTDADATVAADYFKTPELSSDIRGVGDIPDAGILFPFVHEGDSAYPDESRALQMYDRFLRDYAAGLARAGSPYAFMTVGSTMAFDLNAYALVRGIPRREAGEDFHFLSKLAQVGKIRHTINGTVRLTFRPSVRVPFGTGKAVAVLTEKLRRGEPYLVYDPRSFDLLKSWLVALGRLADHRSLGDLREEVESGVFGSEVWEIISALGTPPALASALQTRPKKDSLLTHLHTWFDALKTLRFLHLVRDKLYPLVPMPL